jgi:hypothetical protein
MAAFNKFNDFVEQLCKGVHDLDGTHTIKVMLTNTAPVATNSVKADLTEITAGNGYTAGGTATTPTLSESSGTAKLVLTDVVFTASGGSIGPFRYIVVYNDTATSDNLIGYADYGSSVTLNDTETFTTDFDASNGVLTVA